MPDNSAVHVTVDGTTVHTTTPYHPHFPNAAKKIGGKFVEKVGRAGKWAFDARDEEQVRTLLREVYGTDGTPTATVTIRLDVTELANGRQELYWAGRQVARRFARDDAVTLGSGVVIVTGGFAGRGGSVANPRLEPREGTVLEIRDLPADHPDVAGADIVETRIDRAALEAEQERLRARLADIAALLASDDT